MDNLLEGVIGTTGVVGCSVVPNHKKGFEKTSDIFGWWGTS